ncbi:MAG: hypothetical protein JXA90_09350, partial [Planctomycetes bacterium]|nr:hypothetical protein [Planctomycetota bacterium]
MSNPMLSNVSNAALRNMWISSLWSGLLAAVVLAGALVAPSARAGGVHDLKVLTDASPDYHDLQSLIHSATSR